MNTWHSRRAFSTVALALLSCAPALVLAQAVDPTGHWEGSVQIPGRELTNVPLIFTRGAR